MAVIGCVSVVRAKPRVVGFVVEVACPHPGCGQVHRHHWKKWDENPGPKQPPCRPRGTGMYYVSAPAWSREPDAVDQCDRVAQLLYRLDLRPMDADQRRAIGIAAAALADTVDQVTGESSS